MDFFFFFKSNRAQEVKRVFYILHGHLTKCLWAQHWSLCCCQPGKVLVSPLAGVDLAIKPKPNPYADHGNKNFHAGLGRAPVSRQDGHRWSTVVGPWERGAERRRRRKSAFQVHSQTTYTNTVQIFVLMFWYGVWLHKKLHRVVYTLSVGHKNKVWRGKMLKIMQKPARYWMLCGISLLLRGVLPPTCLSSFLLFPTEKTGPLKSPVKLCFIHIMKQEHSLSFS